MRTLLSQSLFLLLIAAGCTNSCDNKVQKSDVPPAGLAGTGERTGSINLGHPPADSKVQAHANRPIIKGKIVEAIYKEGFAYVRLEVGEDSSTWVAIVNQKPTVGQTISVQEQAVLSDFHSKSLDRTFSKIVFGSIVE